MDVHREPAVAGRFYTGDASRLEAEVAELIGVEHAVAPARALVAPHAGYVYSGAIAGAAYRQVEVPGRAIVLCPNHTGLGARYSVWCGGPWRIPGATVEVDVPLARSLIERTRSGAAVLASDELAHTHEHAVEVHLPFLRARRRDVKVVPICLARMSWTQCQTLGKALASVVAERRARGDDVLIVASTDMSHYVPASTAARLDRLALDRIEAFDAEGLLRVVTQSDISMCGVVPTTVALVASRELGATRARVVRYGHSGETSGDLERVVGYAAAVIN